MSLPPPPEDVNGKRVYIGREWNRLGDGRDRQTFEFEIQIQVFFRGNSGSHGKSLKIGKKDGEVVVGVIYDSRDLQVTLLDF